MRFKKEKSIAVFIALLFTSTLTSLEIASSTSTAKLVLEPAIVYKPVGESFSVNITVLGADFLFAWQVNMSFDPDVLEFINVTEGEFLDRQPDGTFGGIKSTPGSSWVLFGWSTIGDHQGESGSGILATVEFEVEAVGESLIQFETGGLNLTYLVAQNSPNPPPDFEDLEFTISNGLFTNMITPPVADFTYSPIPPQINQAVTFNASTSSTTSPMEIIDYYWSFGDGANTTVTTPITEHTYTTGGIYSVSLTVTDDAEATMLVQTQFNTTDMPQDWYDEYSTQVKTLTISYAHDVAVTSVIASKTEVNVGETVSVTVIVMNKGTSSEDFSVTAYYGTNEISTQQVTALGSMSDETLTFNWDTTGVAQGDYQIKAVASTVTDEGNTEDNTYLDGTVKVNVITEPFPTTLVIGGAIGVIIILAVAIFYMRKRSS